MAGISHTSVLGAGAGVAGAVLGLRFLLRVVGSSVLDVGDRRSDEGVATAEAEAESVSGIGQFHFGARPKFNSTSPANHSPTTINPLNPELNPIFYLLALLGAHHFLHVSRLRVKSLTFRLLMSYIYMEHPFLMFLDHTQRRSTVGRTPLDD